eukprot:c20374_g1_i2.p1 GENE.c20374_g1_i2~~c20374_g1_i2.p1  ORF type:complete len:303 (+),score=116.27 c20374_g1_i2:106-1014(+)
MNEAGNRLTVSLKSLIDSYKTIESRLTPFEKSLLKLSYKHREEKGGIPLNEILLQIDEGRKLIHHASREAVKECKEAPKKEVYSAVERSLTKFQTIIGKYLDPHLKELLIIQKELFSLPYINTNLPSAVLVGVPNVGKSSLVRAISSGTPQVNNYPFTTRGVSVGHFYLPDRETLCQVMDTPGIRGNEEGERNLMEFLTLSTVEHVADSVIFVMDFTGHAGQYASPSTQLSVRGEVKSLFPDVKWIDVVSKCDLSTNSIPESILKSALQVSVVDGRGLDELQSILFQHLETSEKRTQILEEK